MRVVYGAKNLPDVQAREMVQRLNEAYRRGYEDACGNLPLSPTQIIVAAALVTAGDRLVGDPSLKDPGKGLRLHANRPVRVHLSVKRPIAPFALNAAIGDCKRRRCIKSPTTGARRASLHATQVRGRNTDVCPVERIRTLCSGNLWTGNE